MVTNHGPDDALNVRVVDTVANGLIVLDAVNDYNGTFDKNNRVWIIGKIASGASETLVVSTRVNATNTTLPNHVEVTSDTYDPVPGNNSADNSTSVLPEADLSVNKTVSSSTVHNGSTVIWTITVKNNGPDNASNVRVTDVLPDGLVSFTVVGGSGVGLFENNVWTIGDMANGDVLELVLESQVNATNKTIINVVTVESDTDDPYPENNTGENSTFVPAEADLGIVKLVSDEVVRNGTVVNWTIVVTNYGPDVAVNVSVVDEIPTGLIYIPEACDYSIRFNGTHVVWSIPQVRVGSPVSLTLKTRVNATNVTIPNVVNVTSDTYDSVPENNTAENRTVILPEADLSVNKTVSSASVHNGSYVNWTITVVNLGPDVAVNVTVGDVLPRELVDARVVGGSGVGSFENNVWTIGNMTKGQTLVLIIETKVNVTNKTIVNNVNVTSKTDDPNPDNNNGTNSTVVPPEADLCINKSVSAGSVRNGTVVNWTITVVNLGPDVAVNVRVNGTLDDGLIFGSPVGLYNGTFDSNSHVWTIKELPVGVPYTLVISTTVNATNKTLNNTVEVTSDTYDPNLDNNNASNSTRVLPEADLSVNKTVSSASVHNGSYVNWTITVVNLGPDVAVNVTVGDVLPRELVDARVVGGSGVGSFENNVWTIGNMTKGQTLVLIIETKVNVTNKTIVNNVNVTSKTDDPNPDNNNASNSTVVPPEADLEIIKLVSNKTAHKGDVITWTIVVTNLGPDTAVNVVVNEVISKDLINIKFINDYNGTYDSRKNIWTIGNLAKGESSTLIFESEINTTNKTIPNVVNVTSDTYDPNMTNNNATNETVVPAEADLEIVKLVSNASAHVGDSVVWTVIVTNLGPDVAVNVTVREVLPDGLSVFEVLPGSDGKFEGNVWTIGDLSVDGKATLLLNSTVSKSNLTVVNVVNVTSDTYDPNETNNNATNNTVVPPEADLEIIKLVSNVTAHVGDSVVWTVIVTNLGPDVAVNVTVREVLPDGLSVFEVLPGSDGKFEGNVWTIGNLSSNGNATLKLNSTICITNATIVNVVNVTSDTYDPNMTNNNATNETVVPAEADLEIIKLVSNVTAHKGDVVNWTIIVTNLGPDVAVNVVVNDVIPKELTNVKVVNVTLGEFKDNVWNVGNLTSAQSVKLVLRTVIDATNTTIVNNVNVTSDTYDPNMTNNNATNNTVVPAEADLEIIKLVSNVTAHKGDVVNWTIIVTNLGPDVAVNVVVNDVIPKELTNVKVVNVTLGEFKDNVWNVGNLTSAQSVKLVLRTVIDATNTTIVNNVNVTSDTYDPDMTNNNATNETVVPPEADLEVIKLVSNVTAHVGDSVVWTVIVTNNGPDGAVNVVVSDVLPDGLSEFRVISVDGKFEGNVWTIGDLSADGKATLVLNSTVSKSNLTVVNVVNVTSDTYDPDMTNNNATNSTVIPPEADLEVIITNDYEDISCHNGDNVTWTIIVTNHGPDDAINTKLSELMPEGVIFVSDDSHGSFDPETGIWSIGNLTNGDSITLTIVTTVNTTNGTIVNPVNVSSDTYDPVLSNNHDDSSVQIPPEADLEVIKLVSNDAPHKGDLVTWTITVTNLGPDMAVNAVVTDILPSGLIYVADDSSGSFDSETGIWNIGDLACEESITLNIITKVSTTNKTIVNIADGDSDTFDPNKANNIGKNSITVPPEADLLISVVPDVTEVFVGDKVVYTITVVNQGPDTAVNSRATINIPDELKLLGFKPSKGTYDPETGIWTIGDLAPGEEVTLLLDTEALKSGTIVVEASVECDTYESDLTNNYDSAEIVVNEVPPVPGDKVPVHEKMYATGNPIVMALLSLLVMVGITIRRKY